MRFLLHLALRAVGFLPFKAHRPLGLLKQIVIRREGRDQWFLSLSYAHEAPAGHIERSASELAYELDLLDDEALAAATPASNSWWPTSKIRKRLDSRRSLDPG